MPMHIPDTVQYETSGCVQRDLFSCIFIDATVMVAGSDIHWCMTGYGCKKRRKFTLLLP